MKIFTKLGQDIQESLGMSLEMQRSILLSLAVLALMIAIRYVLRRICNSKVQDSAHRYQLNKMISYGVGIVTSILLLIIWIEGKTGLAAYFGLLSAGLAIALQAPLSNLAAWFFISIRKPFIVGDRIQVDTQTAGDVIDVRLFSFSVIEIGNWVQEDCIDFAYPTMRYYDNRSEGKPPFKGGDADGAE
jgi:small-conductance mechanosensitive channel